MNKLVLLISVFLGVIAQAENAVIVDYNNFKVNIATIDTESNQLSQGRAIGALKLERVSPNSFTASLVNSQGEEGAIQIEKILRGNQVENGISVTEKRKVLRKIDFSRVSKSELLGELVKHGFGSAGFLVMGGIAVFIAIACFAATGMVLAAGAGFMTFMASLLAIFFIGSSGLEAKAAVDTARLTSQLKQIVDPIAQQQSAMANAKVIYILCDDSFNAANTRMSCSVYKNFTQTLIALSDN